MGQALSHKTDGTVTELKPRERLVLTHVIDFLAGVPPYESVIVAEFFPSGSSVRLVVTLHPMPNEEFTRMLAGVPRCRVHVDRPPRSSAREADPAARAASRCRRHARSRPADSSTEARWRLSRGARRIRRGDSGASRDATHEQTPPGPELARCEPRQADSSLSCACGLLTNLLRHGMTRTLAIVADALLVA